jgi:hypothetical protein
LVGTGGLGDATGPDGGPDGDGADDDEIAAEGLGATDCMTNSPGGFVGGAFGGATTSLSRGGMGVFAGGGALGGGAPRPRDPLWGGFGFGGGPNDGGFGGGGALPRFGLTAPGGTGGAGGAGGRDDVEGGRGRDMLGGGFGTTSAGMGFFSGDIFSDLTCSDTSFLARFPSGCIVGVSGVSLFFALDITTVLTRSGLGGKLEC